MSTDLLLARLHQVRRTGPGRWRALCPAHDDGNPSLSVRELEDGRTLVHCFALCSVLEVLDAVGLTLDALYPDRPLEHGRPVRPPFPATDVFQATASEAQLVATAACNLAQGIPLSDVERERLTTTAKRLNAAASLYVKH